MSLPEPISSAFGFVGDLIANWMGMWHLFSQKLNAAVNFWVQPIGEIIAKYGGTATSTPTTKLIAGFYIASKIIPQFILIMVVLTKLTDNRRIGILGGVIGEASILLSRTYIITGVTSPFETFNRLAKGPMMVVNAFQTLWAQNPTRFVMIALMAGAFVFISYLAWYAINFGLWGITLMFREQELFSESSAKGHAMWWTLMWLFFLSIEGAALAFVHTATMMATVIIRRGWARKQRRGESITPQELEAVMKNSEETSTSNVEWKQK